MAGHSKWHNIRHKKAANDAKRGKIWTKCAKAIMVAAKNGGSDPAMNLSLRYAIDEARYANMPRDTIERAVKKGAGELDGQDFTDIRYEGYGPGGAAIIVDALTDNKTRTAADIRFLFSKGNGNLGTPNCVLFQFDNQGQIIIDNSNIDADALMDTAIEAGASDVSEPDTTDDPWLVITEPDAFQSVKDALESAGYTISDAAIRLQPNTTVSLSDEDAQKTLALIDSLEDNDDVQKVYTNMEPADDSVPAE